MVRVINLLTGKPVEIEFINDQWKVKDDSDNSTGQSDSDGS